MPFRTTGRFRKYRTTINLLVLCLLSIYLGSPHISAAFSKRPLPITANQERGIVALDQALRDLGNPFTLMCIAAHPGDEDTGTLAYCRRKLGARIVVAFATRGEGGENAIGPELDDELGAIRTREALEACELTGSDACFLNLPDFGFSKSKEEPINTWGHDEAVHRLVKTIRRVRPDIIITGNEVNGYQQALISLLAEAYGAAADPARLSESEFEPWQVSRIFERTDERNAAVAIDLSEYDRVRGATFVELGSKAIQQYASQEASRETAPVTNSYYRLLKPVPGPPLSTGASFFTGLSLSDNLSRELAPLRVGDFPAIEAIGQTDALVHSLVEALVLKQSQGSARDLQERYGADLLRFIRHVETLQRAIRYALGIDFQVKLSDQTVAPGERFKASLLVRNGSGRQLPIVLHAPKPLTAASTAVEYDESEVKTLSPGFALTQDYQYEMPGDAQPTVPHAKHLREEEYYATSLSIEPFGRKLNFFLEAQIERTTITIPTTVRIDVPSRFEINVTPEFGLVKDWQSPRELNVSIALINHTSERFEGSLWIVSLALLSDDYVPTAVSLPSKGRPVRLDLKLTLPMSKPPLSPDVLIELRNAAPDSRVAVASAKIRVLPAGISTAEDLMVGYIQGTGDSLPLALNELGVSRSELSLKEIQSTDLTRFSCILIDRKAYSLKPELTRYSKPLLDYVERGGEIVVFSQRPEDWNADILRFLPSPYPLKLSTKRIALETAPIKLLEPDHALMTKPNQISEKDFEGWVKERADNLPIEWNSAYTPLLESSDPGEPPRRGGFLVASYGKGVFIYTSYSWARQLRAAHPGAYRILANIVSYVKTRSK